MDNFLIQGPKVFIRTGLIIFNQFSKSLAKQGLLLTATVGWPADMQKSALLLIM